MASGTSVTLEVADPTAAFGLDTQVRARASEAPATGFRGFTLSLTVAGPATVDGLIGAALDAGASTLKPFETGSSPVKLALYGRRALAKDAGVAPEGTGSHPLVIDSDAGPFTDPDGFAWQATSA